MNLIIVDFSKGQFRKKCSEKELSSFLVKISPRIYVGDLPRRSIKALIDRFRSVATKNTNLILLIESKEGYHGWKTLMVGSPINPLPFIDEEIFGINDQE